MGDDGWVPVGSERETAASRGESGLSARAGGVPIWRARLVSGAERRSACGERSARLRREARGELGRCAHAGVSNARAGPRECCGPSTAVRSGLLRGLGSGESELALGSDAREGWGQAEMRDAGLRRRGKLGWGTGHAREKGKEGVGRLWLGCCWASLLGQERRGKLGPCGKKVWA